MAIPVKTGIGLRPLPMITMCYTSAMIASPLLTDHILLHNIFLALNALLPPPLTNSVVPSADIRRHRLLTRLF